MPRFAGGIQTESDRRDWNKFGESECSFFNNLKSTRDAGLIIAGQNVEHHEIAAYGSLHTLARVLGYHDIAQTLQQSLDEEKATDKKLTLLAESFVNEQAASESNNTNKRDMDYVGSTYMGSERSGNYGSGAGYDSGSTGFGRGTMGTDTPGGGFSGDGGSRGV